MIRHYVTGLIENYLRISKMSAAMDYLYENIFDMNIIFHEYVCASMCICRRED